MTNQLDETQCPQPDAGTCVRKWDVVTETVREVVRDTQATLRWGLKYFPTDISCGVANTVAVPVGPSSADAIDTSIAATAPAGRTPTRAALQSADLYLENLADGSPRVLVLATDGLPNCAPGAANTNADDSAAAIMAVEAVADLGIPVYVLGIGNVVVAAETLEMMAIAGGRPRPAGSPSYYPVDSRADLAAALRGIGDATAFCAYALPAAPANPADVAIVAAGDRAIPRDPTHAKGWDFEPGDKAIRLYGSWCSEDRAAKLAPLRVAQPCAK
jgi:hypothetical protein